MTLKRISVAEASAVADAPRAGRAASRSAAAVPMRVVLVTMDSPEDTTRIVRAEEAKWRRVVKEQSIKAE